MFDKTTNSEHVQTTDGYIFLKHVHCNMRFLVEAKNVLPCFLNGFKILLSRDLVVL